MKDKDKNPGINIYWEVMREEVYANATEIAQLREALKDALEELSLLQKEFDCMADDIDDIGDVVCSLNEGYSCLRAGTSNLPTGYSQPPAC